MESNTSVSAKRRLPLIWGGISAMVALLLIIGGFLVLSSHTSSHAAAAPTCTFNGQPVAGCQGPVADAALNLNCNFASQSQLTIDCVQQDEQGTNSFTLGCSINPSGDQTGCNQEQTTNNLFCSLKGTVNNQFDFTCRNATAMKNSSEAMGQTLQWSGGRAS